jgi:hypothetical protein
MQLTINGQKVQLNFGVGFVRELDKYYGLSNQAGFNLGLGLTKAIPGLKSYDTSVLAEVIQCASEPSVTLDEVDALIDNPKTNIEKLFDDVVKELEGANAVKLAVKKLKG